MQNVIEKIKHGEISTVHAISNIRNKYFSNKIRFSVVDFFNGFLFFKLFAE